MTEAQRFRMAEAQRSFDRWCIEVADARWRPGGTVGQLGAAEPLRALPAAAYPAVIAVVLVSRPRPPSVWCAGSPACRGRRRASRRRRRSASELTAHMRRRPGPVGALPDSQLLAAIRREIRESPFVGEGHKKLTARLGLRGICTYRKRVLRLMREHALLAPTPRVRRRARRLHDGRITTNVPGRAVGRPIRRRA